MAEPETPRMSIHARERCAEMGISTKVAKRIVQRPDLTRPGSTKPGEDGRLIAVADAYPEYAVVFDPVDLVIVSVLFRTEVEYTREGDHFVPRQSS